LRTSGNICAPTGSPTVSSTATTPSSMPPAKLGRSSPPNRTPSPQSACAIGPTSVRRHDRWYQIPRPETLSSGADGGDSSTSRSESKSTKARLVGNRKPRRMLTCLPASTHAHDAGDRRADTKMPHRGRKPVGLSGRDCRHGRHLSNIEGVGLFPHQDWRSYQSSMSCRARSFSIP
jgi:hypothetical protein